MPDLRLCQRAKDMGIPPDGVLRRFRYPLSFNWRLRRYPGKRANARAID